MTKKIKKIRCSCCNLIARLFKYLPWDKGLDTEQVAVCKECYIVMLLLKIKTVKTLACKFV